MDLSVSKRLDFGSSQVRPTGQVFNLTNELNVVDVERYTGSGTAYRQPVETDFGRILQFGIEVRF